MTTPWRSGTSNPARQIHQLTGHQAAVTSVAVSPDGRRIVSGSLDKTVAVWDLETGTQIHRLTGHQDAVWSVAVSPDGRRIVSGSQDNTVAVWDLESGAPIHRLTGHQDAVKSVAVSPDGRRIVSGSEDNTVAVWDLETGTLIHQPHRASSCGEFRGGEPRRATHRLGVRGTTPWRSGTSNPARQSTGSTGIKVG